MLTSLFGHTDTAQTADDHFSLAHGAGTVTIAVNYKQTTMLLAQRNQRFRSGRGGGWTGKGTLALSK